MLKLFPYAMQGLAYSVSGGWSTTPADHVGLFTAGGETAKPAEFLVALQKVLQVAHHACRTEATPASRVCTWPGTVTCLVGQRCSFPAHQLLVKLRRLNVMCVCSSRLCSSFRCFHDYMSLKSVTSAAHPACLQAAREEAPPSTALATAKAQTMNSFVFNFASSGAQLQRRLIYTLLGVPKVGCPWQGPSPSGGEDAFCRVEVLDEDVCMRPSRKCADQSGPAATGVRS